MTMSTDPSPLQISVIQAKYTVRLHRVSLVDPALCQVVHGTKRLRLGEQYTQILANQWVLLPAQVSFEVENIPNTEGYLANMLTFPQGWASEFQRTFASSLPMESKILTLESWRVKHDAKLDLAWQRLLQSIENQELLPLQKHIFNEVLLILGLSGCLFSLFTHADDGLARRLQQLVMSSPSSDWSQDTVAEQLQMSSPTLRRRLAAEGKTFREILEDVRMSHALGLLQTSRRNIDDIAGECGYACASRFAVRFRIRFGMSPRELRNTMEYTVS